jgi:glucosamine--fructose-6-phosphate aminotransferase (isomerizing)
VKSLGKFPDRFLQEIAGQPAAMRRAAERLRAQAGGLDRVAALRPRSVVFTGMGASYAACYAPVTVLAGRGVPASMVDAAELLHFRRAQLGPDDLLVVVSQSGRSAEAVRLVEELGPAGRPVVVAVTNGHDNPRASSADVSLDTSAGPELGPSTMSFAASLVVLAALAEVLAGRPPAEARAKVASATGIAADAADRLLEDAAGAADRFRAWFDDRPTVVLLGRGSARAASELGALVAKEAARISVEALESAQFRHGPLELAGPGLAAGIVATEPATRDLDRGLGAELAAAGASVLVVQPDGQPVPGADTVAVGELDPGLAPAVAAVPFQLVAWRVAVERGLRPGMLEVATKVTTRE